MAALKTVSRIDRSFDRVPWNGSDRRDPPPEAVAAIESLVTGSRVLTGSRARQVVDLAHGPRRPLPPPGQELRLTRKYVLVPRDARFEVVYAPVAD